MSSILIRLSLPSIVLLFFVACNVKKVEDKESGIPSGKEIFEDRCISCHGIDGKLGLNGAKDLTISVLPLDQVAIQIANGKGAMAPFKNILSIKEISHVSTYTMELRRK